MQFLMQPTVDGSEIRRSPVEVGSLSQYLQVFHGFSYIPGGAGFFPPTVCKVHGVAPSFSPVVVIGYHTSFFP